MVIDKKTLQIELNKELARRDFFHYCHVTMPDFYKYDREYLKYMCSEMQSFYETKGEDVLIINVPPRHGKSLSASKFSQWILGKDINNKIMTASYNATLSEMFSKGVRDEISAEKLDKDVIVYSDIFPDTKIKYGDAALKRWSLEGGYNNYLATSPDGTATGFGASVMILDDIIRNAYEANNANILEKHWDWFMKTMISRLENGAKLIVIMTRWHSDDIAGRALREFKDFGFNIKHINLKAEQEDGSLLCEDVLSRRDLEIRKKALGLAIYNANFQQEPIDLEGRLYGEFKTWNALPTVHSEVKMYMDTADTGADFLSGFIYVEDNEQNIYIKDIIHTDEPMEKTEPLTAQSIIDNQVRTAVIESNNGGRGFKRAVEKEVKQKGYYSCNFIDLHQSKNKESRILSNATTVMNKVYMPELWDIKYPEVYKFFAKYQRTGKNAHDDLADAITGVAERSQQQNSELRTGSRVFGRRR